MQTSRAYGLDWFATLPPTISLTTDRFGAALGPLVFGWMFVAHQIGASIAAYGAGLRRTLDATYAPTFALSSILCVAAGFASLAIDGKRNKDNESKLALFHRGHFLSGVPQKRRAERQPCQRHKRSVSQPSP